ncbi:MAG: ATP-binding protein [Ginsengibacter sp.]
MKTLLNLLLLCLSCISVQAQPLKADSLYSKLKHASTDAELFSIQNKLVDFYIEKDRDSALYFVEKCLALAKKNNMLLDEATSLSNKGHALSHLGRLPEAYACFIHAIETASNDANNKKSWNADAVINPKAYRLNVLAGIYHLFGNLMAAANNKEEALMYYRQGQKIAVQTNDSVLLAYIQLDLGAFYIDHFNADSALIMEQNTIRILSHAGIFQPLGYANMLIGKIYQKKNEDSLALQYYYKAIGISMGFQNYTNLNGTYGSLSQFYLSHNKNADSAIYYARKNLETLYASGTQGFGNVYYAFAKAFELKGNRDSVLKYQSLALVAKDSAYNKHLFMLNGLQRLSIQEQKKLQNFEKREIENRDMFRIYIGIAILVASLIILLILYRNNLRKQKANIALQKAFVELKSTQSQLIQSEKMASLGELTAGIAHEIQNPLNFVNNFSEVNKELLVEMKDEINKGNLADANEIANDVIANEEKINHHGKRADTIVKGMLQHSQSSKGQKQPTDINALCDEYLRFSYHGLRAKDKSFNAGMKTDFDNTIGKINIIPQDIGRVVLNLINNAFYAVSEKKALRQAQGEIKYEPAVSISTRKLNDKVQIIVKDNGNGITQNIVDKIFQPFFTTKPTGQGTGLGLSLSYDIIKAHGGDIKVDTKVDEGSTFTIQLPVV